MDDIVTDSSQLPEPLLSNKVNDVASLFIHGRLLGKLRDSAFRLVDGVPGDDPVVSDLAARYATLRQKIIGLMSNDEGVNHAQSLMPICPDPPTLAQVAFAADQAAGWIETLNEVDGFVLTQRMQAIGSAQATAKAVEEHRKNLEAAHVVAAEAAKVSAVGQYL